MKEYHSIPGQPEDYLGEYCYAFYKYDGSNIRAFWSRKRGWYKFGTRHKMIDINSEYGVAVNLFLNKYGDKLAKAIFDYKDFKKPTEATAFFEYFGPHSFAGWHNPIELSKLPDINIQNNDPKDVVLFDVNIHKRGLVGPKAFLDAFGHLSIAPLLYQGPLTQEFIDDVRAGKYPVEEGVVCKWSEGHHLGMVKIKTLAYLQKLQKCFGVGWKQYE